MFSGIKCIHIVVQPSPISFSKFLSIMQNHNLVPINQWLLITYTHASLASDHSTLETEHWNSTLGLPMGFSGVACGKELNYQCRRNKRRGFDPWVWKIPWRRAWQLTPVFLPGKSHGGRNLVGYSPWSHKESERLSTHICYKCVYVNSKFLIFPTPIFWLGAHAEGKGHAWSIVGATLSVTVSQLHQHHDTLAFGPNAAQALGMWHQCTQPSTGICFIA